MISLEDLLRRHAGLDRRELVAWVENRWVLPERRDKTWIFHDVDVARVELILEIRSEFAIEDVCRGETRAVLAQLSHDIRIVDKILIKGILELELIIGQQIEEVLAFFH